MYSKKGSPFDTPPPQEFLDNSLDLLNAEHVLMCRKYFKQDQSFDFYCGMIAGLKHMMVLTDTNKAEPGFTIDKLRTILADLMTMAVIVAVKKQKQN